MRTYPTYESLAYAMLEAFDSGKSPLLTRAADIAMHRVALGIPHFITKACYRATRTKE